MTENDAQQWLHDRFGGHALDRLTQFVDPVTKESSNQNLIAPSTISHIWSRHVLDSAQLSLLAPADGLWLDIGTGGGFPGMVIAILRAEPMMMVEPRRRRAAFLADCIVSLELDHAIVVPHAIERVQVQAQVISARAVASAGKLLQLASHCATSATRWLLPRGRLDEAELAELRRDWTGMFHVEQSLSNAASSILIADGVGRR